MSLWGIKEMPKAAMGLHIELMRRLSAKELKSERFKDYRIFKNPATSCFDTIDAVIKEAKRMISAHFTSEWKLVRG